MWSGDKNFQVSMLKYSEYCDSDADKRLNLIASALEWQSYVRPLQNVSYSFKYQPLIVEHIIKLGKLLQTKKNFPECKILEVEILALFFKILTIATILP